MNDNVIPQVLKEHEIAQLSKKSFQAFKMGPDEILQAVNEHRAAQLMDKSVQTLRNERFLKKGCPYLKLGKSVRYLISDINNYLTQNRIDPEKV